MAKQAAVSAQSLFVTALRTVFLDLPVVITKRGFGVAEERTITDMGWKGYDASMLLGRASIERLYENRLLGALLARSVHRLLRAERLSNAVTGAFFAVLWRATDVATATEVGALREEVRALATSVARQEKKIDALAARRVQPKPRIAAKATGSIAVA